MSKWDTNGLDENKKPRLDYKYRDHLSDELKEDIIKKMQSSLAKSEKSGVFGQLERARRKLFGTEKERTQAINFEKNKNIIDKSLVDKIESLISLREAARKNKDYIEADRLRDVLSDMDVALNDGSDGVSWKIKH